MEQTSVEPEDEEPRMREMQVLREPEHELQLDENRFISTCDEIGDVYDEVSAVHIGPTNNRESEADTLLRSSFSQ